MMTIVTNLCENTYHGYHQYFSRITSPLPNIQHPSPNTAISQHPTIFLVLSTLMPQRLRGRDDGLLVHSHRQKKPYVTDGREGEGSGVVQPSVCQGTHNQGNPFGSYRRMPSDKLCRKMRYGLQVVSLLSLVLSASIPHRIRVLRQYLHT